MGVTENFQRRLQEHREGSGAEWTKRHPYLSTVSVQPLHSDFEENMKIKELMRQYGIANVRGGRYSRLELSKEEETLLQAEIEHSSGLCYQCKKPGHLAVNCSKTKKVSCERCGRNHPRERCYAHKTIDDEKLCQGINKNGQHCAKRIEERFTHCFLHKDQG